MYEKVLFIWNYLRDIICMEIHQECCKEHS